MVLFDMIGEAARDYCMATKRPDCIYPANFRDKFNNATGEKRWSFPSFISGFYEINSINGVFQHKTKAKISSIMKIPKRYRPIK